MSDVAHALACRGELQFAVWPWAEAHGSTLKRAPRRRSGGVGRNPEPNTWHPRPQGAFTRAGEPAPGRSEPPAAPEQRTPAEPPEAGHPAPPAAPQHPAASLTSLSFPMAFTYLT